MLRIPSGGGGIPPLSEVEEEVKEEQHPKEERGQGLEDGHLREGREEEGSRAEEAILAEAGQEPQKEKRCGE